MAVLSFLLGWGLNQTFNSLETKVISEEKANQMHEDWGKLIIYTDEASTSTYGTEHMLTAVAEIKPGMEIHPPHQHTAEEFMYVIEGNGTWYINGEEFPAEPGDVLYAHPWDWHGLTNTGNTPLRFFVVKWDNKGMPLPVKPR